RLGPSEGWLGDFCGRRLRRWGGQLLVNAPQVELDPLADQASIVHVHHCDEVPGNAASRGRDTEEGTAVSRLDAIEDRDRIAAFDDILRCELEIAERSKDVFGEVLQRDLEAGRPARQTEAIFRVALEINNFTQAGVILTLQALLEGGIDLERGTHAGP